MQQLVVDDCGPQHAGVVAELADLRRGLVHEAEAVVAGPNCSSTEQAVASAELEHLANATSVEVEIVSTNEKVQPSGVTSAHLEAVERAERRLHGCKRVDGATVARAVQQFGD